jgi:hypothetical protein
MSKLTDQNVHGSNSMLILVRGIEVGRCQGVDINWDFGQQPVPSGIGDIMPAEHVALEYRADITVDSFLIRLKSGTTGRGLVDVLGLPANDQILLAEPFDLVVQDKVTREMIVAADRCSWSSGSITIRNGAITGKNARAAAIRVRQAGGYEPKTI